MPEYIDLDTPLELYVEHGGFYRQQTATLRDLLDTNNIPYKAADVRPVVKAFWIDIWSESDPNTSSSAKCSNCYMTSKRPVGNFCKWCGADMREES